MAYLILGQVPVCLCMSWGTALVTVVLMPWMKLMTSGYSEIISKSVVTILRHGSASKGIHPAALYMLWNQEKMLVTVTVYKYIALKRKNINWIIGRSFLTEQPMPGQSFSSEGHAGHCPSIPLRQIMLFFMPRCIVRTWHKRLEASFYHFWHKYKPGAVLLDYYNSKLQSISYQETDLVSCGMRMGATVPQVSRSCNSIWPIPQHCSLFQLWNNSPKTSWDNETGSIFHSYEVKTVIEVNVVTGKASYIPSALKMVRFCSSVVFETIWWVFILLMLCHFEAIVPPYKVLIDSMWFRVKWQTSCHDCWFKHSTGSVGSLKAIEFLQRISDSVLSKGVAILLLIPATLLPKQKRCS